jgi:hypothetical protein
MDYQPLAHVVRFAIFFDYITMTDLVIERKKLVKLVDKGVPVQSGFSVFHLF